MYSLQYLGPPVVWQTQLLGDNTSIYGPNAAVLASGIVYWMGIDKFYKYDGRVQTLNCDLRRFIFSDINKGRIEFVDNRFYATENGNYVPSVTTILEAYPKDAAFFKWLKDVGSDADTIRDEAGKRGSLVHELTEQYDQHQEVTFVNQYGKPKYKMMEWAMFERYIAFVKFGYSSSSVSVWRKLMF